MPGSSTIWKSGSGMPPMLCAPTLAWGHQDSTPVLGLIFLRFADVKFTHADEHLRADLSPNSRRPIGPADYQALGVMYLPESTRYSRLMQLPESTGIGSALNDAMRAIEAENPDLAGVCPPTTPARD